MKNWPDIAVWSAYLRLSILAVPLMLAGCSPLRALRGVEGVQAVETRLGIPYGLQRRHKLDIYRPQTDTQQRPVLVFFYGGSWKRGDRASYRFVGETFAAAGYVTVIPDYRLYPEVKFPEFVADGAQALGWLEEHLPEARNGVVVMGHSAGAHIAALLALDARYCDGTGACDAIRGFVGLAGPYSFRPLQYDSIRPIFDGSDDVEAARPVNFACASSVPRLLLHGEADTVVLPINSERLQHKSDECDVRSVYQPLPEVNHYEILLALSSTFEGRAPVLREIQSFLSTL